MKFAFSTLKDFLNTNHSLEEICKTLTNIGLEVENVEDKSKILAQFSVAKILEARPLENSNKLKICLVEALEEGDGAPKKLQIICGASNARTGIKVAFAPINSIIPSNLMQIKKAKIAGIESFGMLCSAQELNLELNLSGDSEGIIEIDEKFPIGTKISEVYGINDALIEVNITPNRGDCLGVLGIASDLSATGIGTLKPLNISKIPANFKFDIGITNLDKKNCPFISFRILKNIKNCQSPEWLVKKLEGAGFNSISAVVDITNYVMHILNRPMHAYDLNKIDKEIFIKNLDHPQEFISLKNSQHSVDKNILTICNKNKILSVAGIMGSLASACDPNTTNILLESAYFTKECIAYSGRSLNLLSESRSRFERGVDYANCLDGIEMASKLILEICGGEASEIYLDANQPTQNIINFDFTKFKKITGIDIEKSQAIAILEKLQFRVKDNLEVEVPSKRHDISSSEDLIEEILRIYGYDKIKNTNLVYHNSNLPAISQHHKTRLLLASKGLIETINWSFIDKNIVNYFAEINENLIIKNPISQEMNHLRPTLAIGLIKSYHKNYLRNFQNLSLFEMGNIFENENSQKFMLAGLRTGKNKEQNHYHEEREFDFYDVKKDFFDVVDSYGIKPESLQISSDNPLKYYHPHRFACAKLGKNIIGYFGEIHPNINKIFDIKNRLYIFEIFTENLPNSIKSISRKSYQQNDLPIVERDFAFIVDKNLMVGDLTKSITETNKLLIKEVNIFDIYNGDKIANDKKSVALRIKIQPLEKTLTSTEIDDISSTIIKSLNAKFNAKLRDN